MATPGDADVIGRLLRDFNAEYDEATPGAEQLAERIRELIESDEIVVLLAGPDGFALLRFRPSYYADAAECYLAELYVIPAKRGQGIGRSLMEGVLETARERGATHIDLNTSEDDVAARSLYEGLGFTNREGKPDGPTMYYYEREL